MNSNSRAPFLIPMTLLVMGLVIVPSGSTRLAIAQQHSSAVTAAVSELASSSDASVPAQQPAAVKTTTVYGVKIQYTEAGSGPVVVLLHGLGGDSTNWALTVAPLAQKYRVVVLDQVGFGRSDKPLINYRVGTFVDFLYGFLKELKIERASLVGNSLGGWIATAFALHHPAMVDRLVLVCSAGFALPPDTDRRVVGLLNSATREGMRQILPLVFYNKEMFANDAAIDAMFARKMAVGDGYTIDRVLQSVVNGEDVLDNRLAGIKQSTLIIWGREDGLTPISLGERFKKEIPGSEMLVIEKCGHVPQIEKPEEFNAALLKFLGS